MVKGFEGSLDYIRHDYNSLTFVPSGDYLVVEGTSHGKMSAKSWAGGKTPGGRFCNLFKFRDDRISSLHAYLDPDYTGEDQARFRWGKNRVTGDVLTRIVFRPEPGDCEAAWAEPPKVPRPWERS
jgi:hypothetical protein